jgi:hypothetical protein
MNEEAQALQIATIDYEELRRDAQERLPLATQIALAALSGLMLANGGAIVALLTFIGNRAPTAKLDPALLASAFGLFALGVALTVTAHILGYCIQTDYYQYANHAAANAKRRMHGLPDAFDPDKYDRRGTRLEKLAIGACVASMLCFVGGAGTALFGLLALTAPQQTQPAQPSNSSVSSTSNASGSAAAGH